MKIINTLIIVSLIIVHFNGKRFSILLFSNQFVTHEFCTACRMVTGRNMLYSTTIIVSNPDLVFQNYQNPSYLHFKHLKYSTVYDAEKQTDSSIFFIYTLSNYLMVPKGTVFAQENLCFVAIFVLNVFKLMAALEHHLVQHLDGR